MALLTEEKFNIDAKDNDLIETFNGWMHESRTYHDEMLRKQQMTEKYYLGEQTKRDEIPEYLSDTVENRIFEGIETIVPIATANAHQFMVMPGSENEVSVSKAQKLQKVLTRKYRTLLMQEKLENATRKMLLFRFSVLKWTWNDFTDDIDVEEIDPRLIYIPKLRVDPHFLPYVMEKQEYSFNEMKEYFSDFDSDELTVSDMSFAIGDEKSKYSRRNYIVWEVWTDEMVAWISGGKILEKRPNPFWDFEGTEKKERKLLPSGKITISKTKVYFNHLDRPQKPFVFLTTYNISDGAVAPISLGEVGIPIQDAINVENRQIIDNLRRMGNGRVLVDNAAMSAEEANNITNEPGLIIQGNDVGSLQRVRFEPGTPLPGSHFTHLQNMKFTFDNLMGVHSATRGSSQAPTLGQDIISRQQDFTRIDLITRVLNRAVDRLANGLVQLMKLYYTEPHVIKILGEDGAMEFVRLTQEDIEDHIEIEVKSGAVPSFDKIQLSNRAIQLWQLGAVDPVTLFENLEFPNPEQTAERLLAWKQGQLTMQTQAKIAEARAGVQARAEAKGAEEGRGVEMPMNVLQRATANLGGTAPIASGTPKL